MAQQAGGAAGGSTAEGKEGHLYGLVVELLEPPALWLTDQSLKRAGQSAGGQTIG